MVSQKECLDLTEVPHYILPEHNIDQKMYQTKLLVEQNKSEIESYSIPEQAGH